MKGPGRRRLTRPGQAPADGAIRGAAEPRSGDERRRVVRDLGLARYESALEVTIITMAKGCPSSVIQQAHRRQVNFVYARADDLSDSGVSRRDQVPLITRRQARGRRGRWSVS